MEARGCHQELTSSPKFKHSPTTKYREKGNAERDQGGPHKSVTLAPISRYLTDRQYVTRKPLFSTAQQTSILKKTSPAKHVEKNLLDFTRREQVDRNFLFSSREELTAGSFSSSNRDVTPSPGSTEHLGSPLGVSVPSGRFSRKRQTFPSHFSSSRSPQLSLSSSNLEIQRLNPPLRPRLTSTVLYPTYFPRTGPCRPGQTQARLGGNERSVGAVSKPLSFGLSNRETMTPSQSEYWACAIPKALPPSPNRGSPDWDPDREYEELLDYTYPIRPGHVFSAWDSSELLEDTLLHADLQDSGIELENICCSTDVSGLDIPISCTGREERSFLISEHRSSDLLEYTGSSGGLTSNAPLSGANPAVMTSDSIDCSGHREVGLNRFKSGGHSLQHCAPSSSTYTSFIRSTSVLPQSRCVGGEVDEEFWPLPEQLEELQQLSRQVREVTVRLSQPVTASWESLEPGTLPEKQGAEEEEESAEVNPVERKDETSRNEKIASLLAAHKRDSEAVRGTSGDFGKTFGVEALGQSREAEDLAGLLSGLTLPGNQGSRQEAEDQQVSLIEQTQEFCLHLEQLIQQLYTVSQKMELLTTPTVDMDSVKSCLADYQSFQREVSCHRPLSACVLHTGQLLLSCINTTSPLLRDSLLLIEKQSGVLQTQSELFLSSILLAMDSLTHPNPPSLVHNSGEEDLHPVEVQGSAF